MSKFGSLLILMPFLFWGLACNCKPPQTREQRAREKKEMFRNLDNQLAERWGLPRTLKTKPEVVPAPDESEPMPDEVDADGDQNGTAHAFIFDNMVCFSKEKFIHGRVGCLDLRTQKRVFINASQISIPDDVYVDFEVNTSIHIFSFQGKTCIAKNKIEKGLMKCWDPAKAENVSIDTREDPKQ